jgi:hypothetical protein
VSRCGDVNVSAAAADVSAKEGRPERGGNESQPWCQNIREVHTFSYQLKLLS